MILCNLADMEKYKSLYIKKGRSHMEKTEGSPLSKIVFSNFEEVF